MQSSAAVSNTTLLASNALLKPVPHVAVGLIMGFIFGMFVQRMYGEGSSLEERQVV